MKKGFKKQLYKFQAWLKNIINKNENGITSQ